MRRLASLLLSASTAVACTAERLPPEAMRDPQACQSCHPVHYEQWAGSMHAYASADPIFRALNARGQRETNGALGDFCVRCHAPVALAEGLTTDGLNLDEVPAHLQGVGCWFCHSIDAVEGTHNAAVRLADDGVMRGGVPDPVETPAHESAYHPLHDRNRLESASVCGACHDVVTPKGVELERTFLEWKETLFAHEDPSERLTCSACHMRGAPGLAAEADGVFERRIHDHSMPAVDVALTPFPGIEEQRRLVQQELDASLVAQLCVSTSTSGDFEVRVLLENVGAGHRFPSGVTHDRRVWVEWIAERGGRVVASSGVVPDGVAMAAVDDPSRWSLGGVGYDEAGERAEFHWAIAEKIDDTLPGQGARSPELPGWVQTHAIRSFTLPTAPDRVRMRVRLRPVGLDLLDTLIASGDLDPAVRARMPSFELAPTRLEWVRGQASPCTPARL